MFFAFINEHIPEEGYRSVYALAHGATLRLSVASKHLEEHQRFERVISNSEDNPRVINQAGLFTKMPYRYNIQGEVMKKYEGENRGVFIKLNIPEKERRRIVKELSLMNINPRTMFPDLQGSALDCNFRLFLLADKWELI